MRDKNIGAVLVVSDDQRQDLVGIFTERDLVKVIKVVDEGHHLDKPVRTVMTHKVITIEIEKAEEALRVMIENGFRHLPVLARDASGVSHLAGMISMRDIARKLR